MNIEVFTENLDLERYLMRKFKTICHNNILVHGNSRSTIVTNLEIGKEYTITMVENYSNKLHQNRITFCYADRCWLVERYFLKYFYSEEHMRELNLKKILGD